MGAVLQAPFFTAPWLFLSQRTACSWSETQPSEGRMRSQWGGLQSMWQVEYGNAPTIA
jgi:hypothetical protein